MSEARDFWDARAREDALHVVDSRLEYRKGDEQRFWNGGLVDLQLDVGCGVGRLTRAIAPQAARATGIDVSREMIERARVYNAHVPNAEFVLGDGTSLDGIPSASADACVSHVVFQHIPDPEVTLDDVREIGRVLRPGGWAAFQVSNDASVHSYRLSVGTVDRVENEGHQFCIVRTAKG